MFTDPWYGAVAMALAALVISWFMFKPIVVDVWAWWVKRRLAKQIRQWCDADARHRSLAGDALIDEIRIRYDGLSANGRR